VVVDLLQLARYDAAFQPMTILVQFPCPPLTEHSPENSRIHVENVVLDESQLTFTEVTGTVESHTYV